MELMSGVVVEEKGQAWSDLPHGIAVSGRQAFKKSKQQFRIQDQQKAHIKDAHRGIKKF